MSKQADEELFRQLQTPHLLAFLLQVNGVSPMLTPEELQLAQAKLLRGGGGGGTGCNSRAYNSCNRAATEAAVVAVCRGRLAMRKLVWPAVYI